MVVLLSALLLAALWSGPLFGITLLPYDFQTGNFPSFIDAVRAAKFDPFCVYNPFNDAGQVTANLFAFYDPPGWIAAASPQLPSYVALEVYYLAHLLLIPIGLLLVAWANDVPRDRWWAIVPISFVAFAMGPTLKYVQQTNALVALGYIVLLFGALEAFRRTGALWAVILAGLSLAYTNEHWIYASIFVPIPLAAYALANGRQLFGSRRRLVFVACGLIVAAVVALPSALLDLKIDRTIEAARDLQQVNEIRPFDAAGFFGAPGGALPLVALPAALFALFLSGLRHATPFERRVYGVALVALVLYGFSEVTPFASMFRHIYPPAGFIRRPYATWYVLVPLILFLSVRSLHAWSPRTIQFGTIISAIALGIAVASAEGESRFAVAMVGTTLAVTFWRPVLPVLMVALVAQWAVIDWIPFQRSPWHPQPIEQRAAYFAPYETLRSILPFESSRSTGAYRVANVGLPAEFGPSAGAFAVYNTAADYNTFVPHMLVRELGTDQLYSTQLTQYFDAHPEALGGAPWERLAVRYYLFAPAAFAELPRKAVVKSWLRSVTLMSYWHVLEDTRAAPFVAADVGGGYVVPIDAAMTRDSFVFTVPAGSKAIRFAQNYDPWWHAYDAGGADVSGAVRDDGGQLALDTTALSGHSVRLHFTDMRVTLALALAVVAHLIVAVYFGALVIRRIRRALASRGIANSAAS